jgi:hypothetical protein
MFLGLFVDFRPDPALHAHICTPLTRIKNQQSIFSHLWSLDSLFAAQWAKMSSNHSSATAVFCRGAKLLPRRMQTKHPFGRPREIARQRCTRRGGDDSATCCDTNGERRVALQADLDTADQNCANARSRRLRRLPHCPICCPSPRSPSAAAAWATVVAHAELASWPPRGPA